MLDFNRATNLPRAYTDLATCPLPPPENRPPVPIEAGEKILDERKFDFLFLAEGLRLREQNGLIYDLDVVGRPDTFTVLAALAAVTEHVDRVRSYQLLAEEWARR